MDDSATPEPQISVCICTFRRPDGLSSTLTSMSHARYPTPEVEFVVVDNDPAGSARDVVIGRGWGLPGALRYEVEPTSGVGHARNRCLRVARGRWICFVDDDEVVSTDWLLRLWERAHRDKADGVFGPVVALTPRLPPWHERSGFFDRHHAVSGTAMDWRHCASGNVLIRKDLVLGLGGFDAEFAKSGAEDTDLFRRCRDAGARLVWCEEAVIEETVSAHRLSRQWAWLRAYLGGQNFARLVRRHDGAGSFAVVVLKGLMGVLVYAWPAALLAPFSPSHAMRYQCRFAASLGKAVGWLSATQQYGGAAKAHP
jgi:succinoglycan biosynthesis protein ExoM